MVDYNVEVSPSLKLSLPVGNGGQRSNDKKWATNPSFLSNISTSNTVKITTTVYNTFFPIHIATIIQKSPEILVVSSVARVCEKKWVGLVCLRS